MSGPEEKKLGVEPEEKKKGKTAEEKEADIAAAEGAVKTDGTDDDIVFSPEPKKLKLGDREYAVTPLKLKQMRLLMKLSSVNLKEFDEKQLELIIDTMSSILGEPDKDFIEENLDIPTMTALFTTITEINYAGIPKPKIDDRKTSGN